MQIYLFSLLYIFLLLSTIYKCKTQSKSGQVKLEQIFPIVWDIVYFIIPGFQLKAKRNLNRLSMSKKEKSYQGAQPEPKPMYL